MHHGHSTIPKINCKPSPVRASTFYWAALSELPGAKMTVVYASDMRCAHYRCRSSVRSPAPVSMRSDGREICSVGYASGSECRGPINNPKGLGGWIQAKLFFPLIYFYFSFICRVIRDVWPINSSIHHASTHPPASICSALRWDTKLLCICTHSERVCGGVRGCVCNMHSQKTSISVQYLCICKH